MISQRLRACIPALVLALTCIAVAGPAIAATAFDGVWSVLIVSRAGACEGTYRYGVHIADEIVNNEGGGIATVQGRVTPRGVVRVVVQSGSQWAGGSGRLTKNRGGGVWHGQGTSGPCSGTWVAERRG